MPYIKTNNSTKYKIENKIQNLNRENLLFTQTPQCFDFKTLYNLSKLNNTKSLDLDLPNGVEKQGKIVEKEINQNKNLNKEEEPSFKKENDNEILNTANPKEKKVITVELSNDEKIVFSQLGINPLIKLGKEYLNSNHLVNLEDNDNKGIEKVLKSNKISKNKVSSTKVNKKKSTPDLIEKIEQNEPIEVNDQNNLPKIISGDEEINLTDEIDNTRRKRRRSSASIE